MTSLPPSQPGQWGGRICSQLAEVAGNPDSSLPSCVDYVNHGTSFMLNFLLYTTGMTISVLWAVVWEQSWRLSDGSGTNWGHNEGAAGSDPPTLLLTVRSLGWLISLPSSRSVNPREAGPLASAPWSCNLRQVHSPFWVCLLLCKMRVMGRLSPGLLLFLELFWK